MEPYEGWTILELMGHRRLAGYVSEAEIAGGKFIRIDVPGKDGHGGTVATQFYGASSVYCITPTTEDIARQIADKSQVAPVSPWELRPALPAAVPAARRTDDFDDDRDDED